MEKAFIPLALFMAIMVMSTRGGLAGMNESPMPKENDVAIHSSGVEIPLNRILLIRKDTYYCAIKFTMCWTEIDEERMKKYASYIHQGGDTALHFKEEAERRFALYQSFYQADSTKNLGDKNVNVSEGKASRLPLRGPFRPFTYQPGDSYVKCGPIKLTWQYKTGVGFMPPDKGLGDFGYELAPTPWTDMKEVNIKDLRIKWYRYDEKRERVFIPIDRLWGDKEGGK
jgi:hypothetical protein